MDPSAPSQPPLNTAYNHPSNPATQDPVEKSSSQSTSASYSRGDATMDDRTSNDVPSGGPSGQEEATPSSLGAGGSGEKDDPNVSKSTISQRPFDPSFPHLTFKANSLPPAPRKVVLSQALKVNKCGLQAKATSSTPSNQSTGLASRAV